MKRIRLFSVPVVALLFLASFPTGSKAQAADDVVSPGMAAGEYGVGFAFSWPAYGVSGTRRMSQKLTAEAIVAFYGSVFILTGKGRWHFSPKKKYEFYGYGAAGYYRDNDEFFEDTALMLGGGVGLETSLPALRSDDELPPIFFSWEIGLNLSVGDEYGAYSGIGFGGGIHYRFGSPATR